MNSALGAVRRRLWTLVSIGLVIFGCAPAVIERNGNDPVHVAGKPVTEPIKDERRAVEGSQFLDVHFDDGDIYIFDIRDGIPNGDIRGERVSLGVRWLQSGRVFIRCERGSAWSRLPNGTKIVFDSDKWCPLLYYVDNKDEERVFGEANQGRRTVLGGRPWGNDLDSIQDDVQVLLLPVINSCIRPSRVTLRWVEAQATEIAFTLHRDEKQLWTTNVEPGGQELSDEQLRELLEGCQQQHDRVEVHLAARLMDKEGEFKTQESSLFIASMAEEAELAQDLQTLDKIYGTNSIAATINRAGLLWRRGLISDAVIEAESGLARAPGNSELVEFLSLALNAIGDLKRADQVTSAPGGK